MAAPPNPLMQHFLGITQRPQGNPPRAIGIDPLEPGPGPRSRPPVADPPGRFGGPVFGGTSPLPTIPSPGPMRPRRRVFP